MSARTTSSPSSGFVDPGLRQLTQAASTDGRRRLDASKMHRELTNILVGKGHVTEVTFRPVGLEKTAIEDLADAGLVSPEAASKLLKDGLEGALISELRRLGLPEELALEMESGGSHLGGGVYVRADAVNVVPPITIEKLILAMHNLVAVAEDLVPHLVATYGGRSSDATSGMHDSGTNAGSASDHIRRRRDELLDGEEETLRLMFEHEGTLRRMSIALTDDGIAGVSAGAEVANTTPSLALAPPVP